ncbi:MAG: alcohol dehydrogenase catalytic domain-containing protein [Xylanivirga thermophila]|jgi:threonine dehydrogenase-like Zn-dependent dehydrogenase|uniref:zinc-dependent alcohol dehydrogenase n=1 Tax=Xylanivirga thermophila TaxID=2496273 RepID=UPI0039F4A4CB
MATKMQMAELELVDKGTPNSQMVAVLNKPFDISVHYAQIPEPNDDEIRIRIKWVGICGSDLEAFRGNRAPEFITTPARLGHEVAGIVDKVGKNVLGIKVGDRVTCRYVWGAYAQYIVCKPFNVKVMPKDFPMEAVSLIEVLPGIIHAAEIGKIDQTKNVLIMGQGVSGLVMTQVVKLYSPKNLVVTDLYDKKLELSKEYGATHTYKMPKENIPTMEVVGKDFPDGFDVVIPCLLEGNGMIDAIDCCSMGGRIVMYGCIGMCTKPIDFFKVHRKRIDIYSTEPKRDIDMRNYFEKGINMVLDGLVNTSQLVTHKIPLCRIDEAFSIRNNPDDETIHVLIDCEK